MRLRSKDVILWGSVIACLASSIGLALHLHDWKAATWDPSLACNLFTTGLAILVINLVVADFDEKERNRQAKRQQLVKIARQERLSLRRDRRSARRREVMRLLVNWPVTSTLNLGLELIRKASAEDLESVLGHIRDRQKEYFDHAMALGQVTLVYNRFMTLRELTDLEGLRRAVKQLAMEADASDDDDKHKAAIVTALDYVNMYALTLSQAFVDRDLVAAQGVFNAEIGALEHRWNIPAIRKRIREEEAKGSMNG